MISEACTQGRHEGTHPQDPPPTPTLDTDNHGRLKNHWEQPNCTGRIPFRTRTDTSYVCECPCHQPGTTTK